MPRNFLEILYLFVRPLQFFVYFLSGCVRRDPRCWVFGSWKRRLFTDNSAALFVYCSKLSDHDVKPVWITSSPHVLKQVRDLGFTAYHASSPRGIYTCLVAGVFVFVTTTRDINHWLSRGAKKALLRHGTGIKKIGQAHENKSDRLHQLHHGSALQRAFWHVVAPWNATRLDLVLATSGLHAEQALEYFDITPNQIMLTGSPRNDILFDATGVKLEPALGSWIDEIKMNKGELFFYMPTFRDDGSIPFPFSWVDFDRRLDALNAKLLVRTHPADTSDFARNFHEIGLRNIRLHDLHSDPHHVFHAVRALITDYSSVAFDFMLLKRPVIFFTPDQTHYSGLRQFYLDFDEVAVGPRARTLNELESALAAVIEGDTHVSQDAVDRVVDRFHEFRDVGSSGRVYGEVRRRFMGD